MMMGWYRHRPHRIRVLFLLPLLLVRAAHADVTHAQAQCILRDKKLAMFGDSITRFCYYGFNYWLELGELPETEYTEDWGDNAEDYDCCSDRTWTDEGLLSDATKHRMWLEKDFEAFNGKTEFFFVQGVWYDDLETLIEESVQDHDIIVFNTGWWQLKEADDNYCGAEWTDDCEATYLTDLAELYEQLLADRVSVWRTTTCCGEGEDDDGNPDDSWVDSIEKQNAAAEARLGSTIGFADAYPLYGWDDLDDATFDDHHANLEHCFMINMLVLEAIDEQQGGACTNGDATPTYAPSAYGSPTSEAPSREPTTSAPTMRPTRLPTRSPTAGPEPTGSPVRAPTSSTRAPAAACASDPTWFKVNDTSKNCEWAESHSPRCNVKAADGRLASEACCGVCATVTGTPTTAPTTKSPTVALVPAFVRMSLVARFSEDVTDSDTWRDALGSAVVAAVPSLVATLEVDLRPNGDGRRRLESSFTNETRITFTAEAEVASNLASATDQVLDDILAALADGSLDQAIAEAAPSSAFDELVPDASTSLLADEIVVSYDPITGEPTLTPSAAPSSWRPIPSPTAAPSSWRPIPSPTAAPSSWRPVPSPTADPTIASAASRKKSSSKSSNAVFVAALIPLMLVLVILLVVGYASKRREIEREQKEFLKMQAKRRDVPVRKQRKAASSKQGERRETTPSPLLQRAKRYGDRNDDERSRRPRCDNSAAERPFECSLEEEKRQRRRRSEPGDHGDDKRTARPRGALVMRQDELERILRLRNDERVVPRDDRFNELKHKVVDEDTKEPTSPLLTPPKYHSRNKVRTSPQQRQATADLPSGHYQAAQRQRGDSVDEDGIHRTKAAPSLSSISMSISAEDSL